MKFQSPHQENKPISHITSPCASAVAFDPRLSSTTSSESSPPARDQVVHSVSATNSEHQTPAPPPPPSLDNTSTHIEQVRHARNTFRYQRRFAEARQARAANPGSTAATARLAQARVDDEGSHRNPIIRSSTPSQATISSRAPLITSQRASTSLAFVLDSMMDPFEPSVPSAQGQGEGGEAPEWLQRCMKWGKE